MGQLRSVNSGECRPVSSAQRHVISVRKLVRTCTRITPTSWGDLYYAIIPTAPDKFLDLLAGIAVASQVGVPNQAQSTTIPRRKDPCMIRIQVRGVIIQHDSYLLIRSHPEALLLLPRIMLVNRRLEWIFLRVRPRKATQNEITQESKQALVVVLATVTQRSVANLSALITATLAAVNPHSRLFQRRVDLGAIGWPYLLRLAATVCVPIDILPLADISFEYWQYVSANLERKCNY